jgi:hypothetical protein
MNIRALFIALLFFASVTLPAAAQSCDAIIGPEWEAQCQADECLTTLTIPHEADDGINVPTLSVRMSRKSVKIELVKL